MKNGSASVVHVSVAGAVNEAVSEVASEVSEKAEYPNKPAVPSLVPQWQRKAVSLVDDAWQGVASALLPLFFVPQPIRVKAGAGRFADARRRRGN